MWDWPGNERGIGRALSEAFASGRVKREDVWVTTKARESANSFHASLACRLHGLQVWPANYGYQQTIDSVQESANKLGLESIDLVLPHWPGVGTSIEMAEQNAILRKQTWKALQDLKSEACK